MFFNHLLKQTAMYATYTILGVLVSVSANAQVPVTPAADHAVLLASDDPQLAKNKRLVYDMWRTVLEAHDVDNISSFFKDDYIQHNPMFPTGLAPIKDYFSQQPKMKVKEHIQWPLVSIVAERDLVVLAFVRTEQDPADSSKTYTTTWFDMFRIEDGKIAEHWDTALKPPMPAE